MLKTNRVLHSCKSKFLTIISIVTFFGSYPLFAAESAMVPAEVACVKDGLTVGMDDFPPYRIIKKDSTSDGIDIEFLEAVAKDMGCKGIVKVPRPWARQLQNCKDGTLHLVSSATKTAEREVYAYFSPAYMKAITNVFMSEENLKKYENFKYFDDMVHVKKFTLASTTGSTWSEYYDAITKKAEFKKILDLTTDDTNAIQKTLSGRNQAYLGDAATLAYYLKAFNAEGKLLPHPMSIDAPGNPSEGGTSHIMLSRKAFSEAFANKFMASVTKLRSDGTFDKILEKYLGKQMTEVLRIK